MEQAVYTRVLKTACQVVGGIDKLSVYLDVPLESLAAWRDGRTAPPQRVFLKALDLIIDADPALEGPRNAQMVRLLRESAEALASSVPAAEDSPRFDKLLFWDPEFIARGSRRQVLEAALDAALQLTGADAGNVQVLEPHRQTLRIAVQRGFDQPFLDHFAKVRGDARCASAAALTHARRVMIHDVVESEIFTGSPSLEVLLEARCRGVQSTPLIDPCGRLVGMLSTHYGRPRIPTAADEHVLDLIAGRTARWMADRVSLPQRAAHP